MDSSKHADSEALRRLFVLAAREGCQRYVEIDHRNAPAWIAERNEAASHGLLTHGDGTLLVFFRGVSEPSTEAELASLSKELWGYAFLRPDTLRGTPAEVGLRTPRRSEEHYLTCVCDLPLPVEGVPSINGLPFMEQEGDLSTCGHAALWMATRLASSTFADLGCNVVDLPSVYRVTRGLGKPTVPSGGLEHEELKLPLEAAGYAPEVYEFDTKERREKADHIVYRYIESGIPVILWLNLDNGTGEDHLVDHVVVLCGHIFDPDAWWPGARSVYYPKLAEDDRWLSSAMWAPEYLILDDNFGPALSMTRGSVRNRSQLCLALVPKGLNLKLQPDSAEAVALGAVLAPEMIQALRATAQSEWRDLTLDAIHQVEHYNLVARTHLARRGAFKRHLGEVDGYSESTRQLLVKVDLPEYVWLVEISLPMIYGAKRKVGEVVLDPQADDDNAVIAVHLPGVVWQSPNRLTLTQAEGLGSLIDDALGA